jgi:hypothetical protein
MMEHVNLWVHWLAMLAIILSSLAAFSESPRPSGVRKLLVLASLCFAAVWALVKVWQLCCMEAD